MILNKDFDTDIKYGTILADPPWRFNNRTGRGSPEHRRLFKYPTMTIEDIAALPIKELSAPISHLYLWCPNALMIEGLRILDAWGFVYKTNIIWYKVRKDGGTDCGGRGFYFRNSTELCLFGIRGKPKVARTLAPGRSIPNVIIGPRRRHSRKPDELYDIIEGCSTGPYLELFARYLRDGWNQWGNECVQDALPTL